MSDKNLPAIPVEKGEIAPSDIEGLWWLANRFSNSGMVPKTYVNSPEKVIVAWDMGLSLGLNRTAALQNIAVINGMPSVWGDAALGLVQNCEEFIDCIETFDGDMWDGDKINKNFKAVCTIKLKDREDVVRDFSIGDAINADLWNKDIWKKYPKRMLQMRARSWAIRDALPGALKGLKVAEEAMDYDVNMVQGADGSYTSEPEVMSNEKVEEALQFIFEEDDMEPEFFQYLIKTMEANDADPKAFLEYVGDNAKELMAAYKAEPVVEAEVEPEEEAPEPDVVKDEAGNVVAGRTGWKAPDWAAGNETLLNLGIKFNSGLKNVVDWINIVCERQDLRPGDVVVYIEKHIEKAEKTFGDYVEEIRRVSDEELADSEGAEIEREFEKSAEEEVAKEDPVVEPEPKMTPAAEIRLFNHMSAADLEEWVTNNPEIVDSLSEESHGKLVAKWDRLIKKPFPGGLEADEEPQETEPVRTAQEKGPDLDDIESKMKDKIRTRLLHLRKTYPNTCEEIREKHGFGQMVASDNAARIWVDDVVELLAKKKSAGKELD